MSVKEKMTAIADNIREKTSTAEPLTLDDMASGVNEVYEAGKKIEYDNFWDNYQIRGTRTNYNNGFYGAGWNENNFYPKYDIRPTGNYSTYIFAAVDKLRIDLEKRLNACGVVLDFSQITQSDHEFYLAKFTKLPVLDFSGCKSMTQTFDYCAMKQIQLILSDSGETTFSSVFRRCSNLTEVSIERGVVGKSISFTDSPLNVISAIDIITHLKNYTGTDKAGEYTLTFNDATKTALQEAGAIDELGGKTYDAYIADKGWNLA